MCFFVLHPFSFFEMFMWIHQSKLRFRIVLDPMKQIETSGLGIFSQEKVAFASNQQNALLLKTDMFSLV